MSALIDIVLCPTGCFPHRPLCTAGPGWDRKGVSQLHEAPNPPPCTAVGNSRKPPGYQVGAAMEGPKEGKRGRGVLYNLGC